MTLAVSVLKCRVMSISYPLSGKLHHYNRSMYAMIVFPNVSSWHQGSGPVITCRQKVVP
jgi:hypothetical protein